MTEGDPLYSNVMLVVQQKAKLIELQNEYKIFDADGVQVGAVRQIGQGKAKKVMRFVSSFDQFMTHRLEVVDSGGVVRLRLVRPAKFAKSRIEVSDGSGKALGKIVQQNVFGKINFSLLDANGEQVGSLRGQNWRAWNFDVVDANGEHLARIDKEWEGLAKTVFTTADNYKITRPKALEDPLGGLVLAAALAIDTALKQDARGFG
jgi:uncharacterized protein YxjI